MSGKAKTFIPENNLEKETPLLPAKAEHILPEPSKQDNLLEPNHLLPEGKHAHSVPEPNHLLPEASEQLNVRRNAKEKPYLERLAESV